MGNSRYVRRRRLRRLRHRLVRMSAMVGLLALATLLIPGVAFAATYAKGQIWSPPQTPLQSAPTVPGHYAAATQHPTKPTAAPYRVPVVDLPRAGSATAALATTGTAKSALTALAGSSVVSGIPARVGTSPLWVASAASGAANPTGVQVRFADPAAVRKAGFKSGLLFGVGRSDQTATAGRVALQVDPKLLTGEGGGDLGSRLRLVALPACALTTPNLPACQTQTPVHAVSDPHTGRIVGDITLPATTVPAHGTQASTTVGSGAVPATAAGVAGSATSGQAALQVFTMVSGPSGPSGTYAATSLKPSDQWSAGGSTGDFSYSYPVDVPDTLGGAAPSVSLDYSSSSVDGETASTNSQPSWTGDGWSGVSNFIERSYQPCSQDGIANSGDTCWGYAGHEVTLSGSNMSGQLVWDDATSKWHPSTDNGSTITQLTGLANGAYNGEGWLVTLRDGTRLYYGAGKLPTAEGGKGTDTATNSVSTEPVYCPKTGDCDKAATGAGAFTANMPYRWNLDLVVDPHGNATEYTYTQATNYYARSSAHTDTLYDRDSYPTAIKYGWRTADIAAEAAKPAPAAQILFTAGQRCMDSTGAAISTCPALTPTSTAAAAANWPDVPQDQLCAATGTCTTTTMSFFTEVRLSRIQTQVNTGSTTTSNYKNVDTYDLAQSFPAPGDGTSPALRLESVTRTGSDGTTGLPAVTFEYAAMANRVPGAVSWPAFNRFRITAVDTEAGGNLNVAYSGPDCNQSPTALDLPTPSNDTRSCYQEYWNPPTSGQITDWFEKYRVTEVRQIDTVGGAPAQYTDYSYPDPPAWHRNDSALTPNATRTWDQFRGYGQVTTQSGHGADPISQSTTTYFRGMEGDFTNTTGTTTRTVPLLTDTAGDQVHDLPQYAGMALESQTYTAAGGSVAHESINLPWSQLTATHAEATPTGVPAEQAHFVAGTTTISRSLMADGTTWRTTKTVEVHSPTTGLLTQTDTQGDTSLLGTAASQETCSTISYATAPSTWGIDGNTSNLAGQASTVAVTTGTGVGTSACPAKTAANTTADTRDFYDGATTAGTIPAAGAANVTEIDVMAPWTWTTENFTKKTTAPPGPPDSTPTAGCSAPPTPAETSPPPSTPRPPARSPPSRPSPTSLQGTGPRPPAWTS